MAEQIKFGDNLYLQGEKLVLDNGANAGVIKSNNGTVKIEGNLEVSGTTTTISSETVTFDDNILLLNSNETGTPSQDGGIEIERGTSTNKLLTWSESTDKWTVGAESFVAATFEGALTGNSTGTHTGAVSGNVTSTGTSTFTTIDINGGNIDGTTIGATTPAAGTFSTITGDGTAITNVLENYTTTNLTEGTKLFFTNERVDDRIDALFTSAYGITGTYNDAGDNFTLSFDTVNAGTGNQILDTSDTTQAKFRTIREGKIASGGNGDLTCVITGDDIVIDTAQPINQLEYTSFTGNGSTTVYTLPYTVSQDWQILVYIAGVVQHPATHYSVSGTTLTLTTALPNSTQMNVLKMATNSVASVITNALTLGGNTPAHYLSWAQFTGTPTTIAGYGITDEFDGAFASLSSKPTTLSGYGISDAMTATDIASYDALKLNKNGDTMTGHLTLSGAPAVANHATTKTYVDTLVTALTVGVSSVNTKAGAVTLDSGDISENGNLYFTNARADARAQLKIDSLVGGASAAFDTLVEIQNAMATDSELTSAISGLNHDTLAGFIEFEHIDWTVDAGTDIHASNYSNTGDTTYTAGTNISISGSNVISSDQLGSIVPSSHNTFNLGSASSKYANIHGVQVHATYADLAERYASDIPYDEGTVVVLGGDEEITVTSEAKDVSVAGVISINPGLKMNADAGDDTTHPYVALRGRVPCKMIGPVSKGDLIVTADNEPGYAQSVGKENAGRSVFAKSIETDLTEGKRLIEVVIL